MQQMEAFKMKNKNKCIYTVYIDFCFWSFLSLNTFGRFLLIEVLCRPSSNETLEFDTFVILLRAFGPLFCCFKLFGSIILVQDMKTRFI